MKVSAISVNYDVRNQKINNNVRNTYNVLNIQNKMSTIAFRSGNPRQLLHQISELTIFGQSGGGVGTVGNDLFFNIGDFDRVIQNIPLYNQEVMYVKDIQDGKQVGIKQNGVKLRLIPRGLPENHPFKQYENKVFTTPLMLGKDINLADELAKPENYNKIFILDEVGTSEMSWGLENKVPIGTYIMRKDDKMKTFLRKKGWTDEMINKIDITFTYVDATASMPKPYADGSYSTASGDDLAKTLSSNWQGKPYPKEAKATAVMLPKLKEKLNFDPKYIVCHDGQAMPLIHYIAEMNASGEECCKGKSVTAYGHNLNDGYMYSLSTKDAIVAIAKKDEIRKIINSQQYISALQQNKEDEFLKTLLPKEIFDARGQINAVMFPIAYGEKGYLPMFTTVSDGYYKSIIENELISPALYSKLKDLSQKGVFRGIINVLMDPLASGFTIDGLQDYYKNDFKIKLADGQEIDIQKFKAFDETKKYDLNHIREVKRHNKISLLKRLDTNLAGAQLYRKNKDGVMQWLEKGTGYSAAVTGGIGRKFKILGGIDKKYIQMLENGQDVPMFVSWGRGDFQKGMDTGFEAWIKFVKNTGNEDSLYVFGGDMTNIRKEINELIEKYSKDKDLAGRFICLDGWAPGNSFAAAGDYAALASRFAPCELTDLESMKKCCTPIVPKVQGMDQKVFDPSDKEHAQYINGYKGQHEYYMTEADALSVANDKQKTEFINVKENVIKELKKDYRFKMGEDIPEELLNIQLKENNKYKIALQKLRDSVISDEMADSMARAIKDRNSEIANKVLKNHVDLKTTWYENGWCNPGNKSTGQLVREMHFNPSNGKNLKPGEELKLNISGLTEYFSGNKKSFFKTRGGKLVLAGIGIAALGGIMYSTGEKDDCNTPQIKSGKHISTVV